MGQLLHQPLNGMGILDMLLYLTFPQIVLGTGEQVHAVNQCVFLLVEVRTPQAQHLIGFVHEYLSIQRAETLRTVHIEHQQPIGGNEQVQQTKQLRQVLGVNVVDAVQRAVTSIHHVIEVQRHRILTQNQWRLNVLHGVRLIHQLHEHIRGGVHRDHLIAAAGHDAGQSTCTAGEVQQSMNGFSPLTELIFVVVGKAFVWNVPGQVIVKAGKPHISVHHASSSSARRSNTTA